MGQRVKGIGECEDAYDVVHQDQILKDVTCGRVGVDTEIITFVDEEARDACAWR